MSGEGKNKKDRKGKTVKEGGDEGRRIKGEESAK